MSPRGKAIPGLQAQLFDAAGRVLARTGPLGLTSRAVTDEAAVAKGVLHNHYGDLTGFLAAFVLHQSARLAATAHALPARAGEATVLDNFTEASAAVFGPPATQISGLVMSRPDVAQRLLDDGEAVTVLDEIQAAFEHYLAAEQSLGRIAAGTDVKTLAFTVIASVHHLFLTASGRAVEPERVRTVLTSLLAAAAPATPSPSPS